MSASIINKWSREFSEDSNSLFLFDESLGELTKKKFTSKSYVLSRYLKTIDSERIGIMLPASGIASILVVACYLANKIPVMVNWTLDSDSFDHCINNAGISCIITSNKFIDKVNNTTFKTHKNRFLFLENIKDSISIWHKIVGSIYSTTSILPKSVSNIAVILFTSGSEKLPKIVPLTHKNIAIDISGPVEICLITKNDKILSCLPPFHSFGFSVNIILPLIYGIPIVYTPDPIDISSIVDSIHAHSCTVLTTTPTFLNLLLDGGIPQELSTLRLIVVGGEKCSIELYDKCKQILPDISLVEGYGTTECSPVVSLMPPYDVRIGTVGKLLPYVDARIINQNTLLPIPNPEIGLLCVKGSTIFAGYESQNNDNVFQIINNEKYYNTGDICSIDDDGFVTLHGRASRYIKLGGEMISLPNIETIINKYLGGDNVLIESVHYKNKNRIFAFSLSSIQKDCLNNILYEAGVSSLVKIQSNVVIERFPTLGSGKIDYKQLKAFVLEKKATKKDNISNKIDILKEKIAYLAGDISPGEIFEYSIFGKDICLDSIDVGELMVFVKNEFSIKQKIDPSHIRTFGDLVQIIK